MSKQPDKLPSLEVSLSEISQLIDKMEHNEMTLEQSLTNFERGVTLIKHCQKMLQEAEQKVAVLMQNNTDETLAPYGSDTKTQGLDDHEQRD